MRAFVFRDESLARHAGRFVWLELDTDRKQNAGIARKLSVRALPTYFVVDPADEKVAMRWIGGATVAQLHKFLDDAVVAVQDRGLETSPVPADRLLARADRLYGEGKDSLAALAYREALAEAPPSWPHYGRAAETALFLLDVRGESAAEAELAREALPRLRGTTSGATVASSGLGAALALPDTFPGRGGLAGEFEAATRDALQDVKLDIADDDRSSLYYTVMEARSQAADSAGARQVALEWAAFLEGAASRAKTAEQRAVYDGHRVAAYRELGEPERAIPVLEASERDLPDDYNPAARLAGVYLALKRWDDALAACDRALAKVYGPRRLSVLSTRASILNGKGDREAARRTLEEAVAYAEALPPGQRSERLLSDLRRKIDELR